MSTELDNIGPRQSVLIFGYYPDGDTAEPIAIDTSGYILSETRIGCPDHPDMFDDCFVTAASGIYTLASGDATTEYHITYGVVSVDLETNMRLYWLDPDTVTETNWLDLQLTDFGGIALPIPASHEVKSPAPGSALKVEIRDDPVTKHSVTIGGHFVSN